MRRSRKIAALAAGVLLGATVLVVAPSSGVNADSSTLTCKGADAASQSIVDVFGGAPNSTVDVGLKTSVVGTTVPPGNSQEVDFKTTTVLDPTLLSAAAGAGVTSMDIKNVKYTVAAGANVTGSNQLVTPADFTINLDGSGNVTNPSALSQGPFATTWNITGAVGSTATWNLNLATFTITVTVGTTVNINLTCTATKPAASALILPPQDERGPKVPNLSLSTDENTPVDVNLLDGVQDGAAPTDPSTLAIVSDPSHGSVTLANGVATYTPDNGFTGDDQFAYQVCTEDFVTTPGVNEQQTVTLEAEVSGEWWLTFDGQQTATLQDTATAADVQTALENLSNIGAGNVTVTGTGTNADPFVVTFTGDLGNQDVPELEPPTGNDGPTVTIATTQAGAADETGSVCNTGVVTVAVAGVAAAATPVTTTPQFTG